MATRFKKPISREIDLPATDELTKQGTCKVVPHVVTFDDIGVTIRRKNSKTVLFAEWRQIYLNRLNSGIFHTQESAEAERELRREEAAPKEKRSPKPKKQKPDLRESPVSDDSEAPRPELPTENEPEEDLDELGRQIKQQLRIKEVTDLIEDTAERIQKKNPTLFDEMGDGFDD